jgi:hypothetical protein
MESFLEEGGSVGMDDDDNDGDDLAKNLGSSTSIA